ncbi:MAG: hypothetical protein A3H32_08325 [Betaproteobacteria bacterium RIFCSPLOWO2_02_FULL_63_19]|nr:MAG: hypothetical protein A3H32_08325 [Betaproteobacteria bacterium RIFCSPLOWO2_02_FULL_63_19]
MPLYLLIFFSTLSHSAFIGCRVIVSLYAIHLQGTPFTVGTLIALFGLLPMLLSLAVGRLIDRLGGRIPMLVGSVFVAAGMLLPPLVPGIATLYLVCPLIGLAYVTCHLSVQSMVGLMGKAEDRPANFSHLSMAFSVSAFLGPMFAGLSIDWLGYSSAFTILSLLPLVSAAALVTNRLKLPAPRARGDQPGKPRVADLLRHRELRSVFVVTGLHAIAWELFSFMTPVYGSQVGLSASAIGVVMASFAIASFTIRLALPYISRRITPWRLLRDTMLLAALAYALFPVMTQLALLMTLAFVLGMSLGCSQPMVMTLLHDTAPEGRTGEAVGMRATIVTTGQTLMPLLFGAVGSVLSVAAAFWATALALGLGSRVALRRRVP